MTSGAYRALTTVLHLALAAALVAPAVPASAQGTVTPTDQAFPPQPAPGGRAVVARAQLDAMLAPIALYPDQLLTQILMAAAYPQEVAAADRWVKDPAHAGLRGEQLAAALAPIDWDPSVKSLIPFPPVLATMAEHLDWTAALGEAFLAQQPDVLAAVQELRRQAQAAGYLRSTPQMTVAGADGAIVIEPADPTLLYVPAYDPDVVYGAWLYPAYPPVPIYPRHYYAAPIVFGTGLLIVRSFWNWHRADWRQRRVWIDRPRFNAINAAVIAREHRRPADGRAWQADPHRRSDPASAASGWRRAPDPPRTAQPQRHRDPPPSPPPARSLAVVPPAAPHLAPAAPPPAHFSAPSHYAPPVHAAPSPPQHSPPPHSSPPPRSSSERRHHGPGP